MSESKKRAAIYCRVSTLDQHPETQLIQLRQVIQQRGWDLIGVYTDHGISGARARRPQLDQMLADARHAKFDVVLVWAFDRMARSTKHLLEVVEELQRANVEFVSLREQIDTGGPLGRAITTILGAIAELERSLIIERVRAGMNRTRLEGGRLGRPPLENIDREEIRADRLERGYSLKKIAKLHRISKTSVQRILKSAAEPGPKSLSEAPNTDTENNPLTPAA
jgi:DNA invertase Pin-like site-specific DNA recombinase